MTVDSSGKSLGQGRGGSGFSFDDREGGRGQGRGRGPARPGGRGGRDRRDGPGDGAAAYRIVNELSALEKALTKSDFVAMKEPLNAVLRAVRPLRLKSLEQLDLGIRGKLITSLMRAQRLSKPSVSEGAGASAPTEPTPTQEGASAEAPPAAEGGTTAEAAAPTPPAVDPRLEAWRENQFTVGLIWSSIHEAERAQVAFASCGRQPTAAELAVPSPAEGQVESRRERPERGPKQGAGAKGAARGPRTERSVRPERPGFLQRTAPFVSSGDWQADVKNLEELGRTRDAARIHEKNKSFAEAMRLFESGGDLKSGLRCAAAAKNDEAIARLSSKLKPGEIVEAFERAEAWEKLMEFHVKAADYESIAKLYERATQFDQAALAWERAGKLPLARKAYERAKDFASANRVRSLEVQKLIERGDRLGAATLLVSGGKKTEALETLKALPGPKAFHFMQKLKLSADAEAFAKDELAKAEASNNGMQRARWLELLGRVQEAANVYLAVNRKDRAAFVFEGMGELRRAAELLEAVGQLDKAQALFERLEDTTNAERVKALPRPVTKEANVGTEDEALEAAIPPSETAPSGSPPTATA